MDEVDFVYEAVASDPELRRTHNLYHSKVGGSYQTILTIFNRERATREAERIRPFIQDRVVVEIGAGIGLLAVEMAKYAREVYAIEVDPAWTWVFVKQLYREAPLNLVFIFGDAKRMIGKLTADVAVIYTCSDVEGFLKLAEAFQPKTIILNGVPVRIGGS